MLVVVLGAVACLLCWRNNILIRRQIDECLAAISTSDNDIDAADGWHLFGTECPKEEIVFFCQVIILYTVIVVSIYNLTVGHGDSTLWTALLSSSLGYLLPNPSLKREEGV